MQLTIDTSQPLSELDVRILSALLRAYQHGVGSAPAHRETAESEPVAEEAPKARRTRRTRKPEPDPEAEAEEDLLGGADEAVTRDDVVAKATKLISEGKRTKVSEALASLGHKRVGEVPDAKLGDLLRLLEA